MKQTTAFNPEITYSILLFRHLDRISEGLKQGLDVAQISNNKILMAYYSQVRYLEGLCSMHLPAEYYNKKHELFRKMPSFSSTWSGDLGDNTNFLNHVTKWFELILAFAHNLDLVQFKARSWETDSRELKSVDERDNEL